MFGLRETEDSENSITQSLRSNVIKLKIIREELIHEKY